ncbi:MAG: hypothetical protein IJ055_07510, partial [Oscillospiraceae bacterium]|nr:hypothetical protein [Oscillospiraceae bacterium]
MRKVLCKSTKNRTQNLLIFYLTIRRCRGIIIELSQREGDFRCWGSGATKKILKKFEKGLDKIGEM